ncbi:Uncharacterised protein [Vibrio cholerae]|nr:Uncharacterised protein [Vibrio cholerae]CSI91687.1 Uncharacterised protein [Vibrio cholerae]
MGISLRTARPDRSDLLFWLRHTDPVTAGHLGRGGTRSGHYAAA